MNSLRDERFRLVIVLGLPVLSALAFWICAWSRWDGAAARFSNSATERNRLERLLPYPNEENLNQMRQDTDDYAIALNNLKNELREVSLPLPTLVPSEFQSALRISMSAVSEKARASGVKLPNRFALGFDEFTAALPSEKAAPMLGQELAQVEWLTGLLIDASVEAVGFLRRTPLPEEQPNKVVPKSGSHPAAKPDKLDDAKKVSRNAIELAFVSSPISLRKFLNQIASDASRFCIVRRLHVRNEREKGPARVLNDNRVATLKPLTQAAPASINFIVGEERIETVAIIEFVRFDL